MPAPAILYVYIFTVRRGNCPGDCACAGGDSNAGGDAGPWAWGHSTASSSSSRHGDRPEERQASHTRFRYFLTRVIPDLFHGLLPSPVSLLVLLLFYFLFPSLFPFLFPSFFLFLLYFLFPFLIPFLFLFLFSFIFSSLFSLLFPFCFLLLLPFLFRFL